VKFAASCPATSTAATMEHCFALRKKVDYVRAMEKHLTQTRLNRLAFAYRWSTRAIMLDKTDATKRLTRSGDSGSPSGSR
jgi:hypothetical protein